MFDILLPADSERPLYEQIYRQIRESIREGKLSDGMRMPSVRTLQSLLHISKTPIETAYQMLIAEGFVVSKPRSGLYVSNPYNESARRPSRERIPAPSPAMQPTGNPAKSRGFDFDPTALDSTAFPLAAWNKTLRQAFLQHADSMGRYGDPQGEYGLRRALADYLRNSRGVACTPEQIVLGTGMAYSIGIISKLLTGADRIAFEDPGYNLVRDQLALNGWDLIPIPVGGKGISLDALEASDARAVYVTPSHQFPTGAVMPFPERERLLGWAANTDGYIIEDDYDGEYRYAGKPIPSLQGLDRRGRVIYIGTFSKTFTPALRMNYIVLPVSLIERLRHMQREVLSPPSRIDQWAMLSFMEQGHWYRHLRRVRSLYRNKHRHLIDCVQKHFGDLADITGQDAGLHIQVTVRHPLPASELVRLAEEAGVSVYDFRKMYMAPNAAPALPTLYLGFAGTELSGMDDGVRLLKKAWFGL